LALLNGCHEAVPVAAEGLDAVLLHAVVAHGLADHAQASRQRCFGDELVEPTGRQEFVFRDRTMALRQEMDEDQKRLGLEGTDDARPAQFPAVNVEGALTKHKEHRTTSYGMSVLAPRASHGTSTATVVALPDRGTTGSQGS
jgi:hypothetical protein